MSARIYKPAKTAQQSGTGKTKRWLLEFPAETARGIDPLMGWTSSRDTKQQVKLWFETKEQAVAYAQKSGIAVTIQEPEEGRHKTMSYADNFKFNRSAPWTH